MLDSFLAGWVAGSTTHWHPLGHPSDCVMERKEGEGKGRYRWGIMGYTYRCLAHTQTYIFEWDLATIVTTYWPRFVCPCYLELTLIYMPFSRCFYPKRLIHVCIHFTYGWSRESNSLSWHCAAPYSTHWATESSRYPTRERWYASRAGFPDWRAVILFGGPNFLSKSFFYC
jgi:hypothetical protein